MGENKSNSQSRIGIVHCVGGPQEVYILGHMIIFCNADFSQFGGI